ncbi:MAG: glycosyltransferase [Thermoleophilia bacterium]|nr:glycosyltransferase [Thermoleophilia bacterium]
MRVAMVSEHASPLAVLGGVDAGGQNVHVASLSQELACRGCEVTVFTRRDDGALPDRVEFAPGVTVEHVPAGPARAIRKDALVPYMGAFARFLRETWAESPPDLVHAHFWMSGRATLEAARPYRIPVVQTFHALGIVKRRHQGQFDTSPPGRHASEEAIARRVDQIIATSSDEVFELLRMGADLRRVRIVPCGVDLALFHTDGPAEPRREGLHRLVVVSRLVQRKGVGNVISALVALPSAELVVAGGGEKADLGRDPEARRLAALADELGVRERVDFRGRVERADLPALLRSADAVVCVPWYEPFGIVPLEAMACGVPVVASAVGGLLDTVVDAVTGLHVPPRSPDRLAEALRGLLADPELRARLGRAGAERARSRYSWGDVAEETLEVYRRLRASRRVARVGVGGGEAEVADTGERAPTGRDHVLTTVRALGGLIPEIDRIDGWGRRLARVLVGGGRLLAAGNGGSAAQAQHLTGELVGRYCDERLPLSALALHADTSSLTAIANDYGGGESFARQVRAHGRPGDVLLVLTTSGRSPNIVAAVEAALAGGLTVWALTGPTPNPAAELSHDAVAIDAPTTASVQEIHMVAVHLLCAAVDREVRVSSVSLTDGLDEVLRHGLR